MRYPVPPFPTPWNRIPPLFLLSLVMAVPDWLRAQATKPIKEESGEESVALSPFRVDTTKDEGWLASNTMLSSRTNQELKNVPVTIESLTQEFMRDVGVHDAYGAAAFIANSLNVPEAERLESTGQETPDSNRYSYRGIPSEGGPKKNLFSWMTPSDNYNVERIDFGRGSNSLLFGDSEPGGQGNIYTKRARPGRNFGDAYLQLGSKNAYRADLDYNFSLSKRLAARVNVTKHYTENYYDWYEAGEEAAHVALQYQPFKNTILRVEGEKGHYDRNLVTNTLRRFQTRSNGRGFNQRYTVLPDNSVIDNRLLPAVDRTVGGGVLFDYLDVNGGPSKEMSWEGYRTLDQDFYNYSVYVEQRIGKVGLEVAAIRQFHQRTQDQSRHNNQVRTDSNNRPFMDHSWTWVQSKDTEDTVRITAVYDWQATRWMSQLFVANANWTEWRRISHSLQERNFADTGGPAAAAARPWYRVYLDDPSNYQQQFLRRHDVPKSATVDIRPWVNNSFQQLFPQRDFSLSMSGRYFDGRLFSMVGARLDRGYRLTSVPWGTANRTTTGEAVPPGSYDEHPERFILDPAIPGLNELTDSYGLVYTLNSRINLYTTISESFRQANGAAVDFSGEPIGQQRGKTFEVGIKSDFFNKRMSLNLNYYDLERSNVEFNFNLQGMTLDELEDVLNPNNLNPGAPGYVFVDVAREKRKQFSEGVESTFLFYPGDGWNIKVSAAYKKVTQDESMPRLRQYVAAATARGGEDPTLLSEAQTIIRLSGLDGQEIVGRHGARFSFSYAVKYAFNRKTALKGLSLGVNGQYNDDFIFNYLVPDGSRGGKLLTVNGFLGYQTRVFKRPTVFRLNIENLVESEYITRTTYLFNGALQGNNVYGPPRAFALSASTTF
ncbi:MAG: TonB-dependent receptor [Opitutaceae bacterium]